MLFIIKSDSFSIRKKIINKLIQKNQISTDDIFSFDYEEKNKLNEAFSEFFSFDIFNNKKCIIVNNANFINFSKMDKNINKKVNLIKDKNINNILILIPNKINKSSRFLKKYNVDFNILEKDSPSKNQIEKFIFDFFDNKSIRINKKNIKNILNKSSDNFDILLNELNKISILNISEVTEKIVEETMFDFSRERLYKISDYVLNLDIEKTNRILKQFKSEGESIYLINEFLLKGFSKFMRYKILLKKGFSKNEILKMTGWNYWEISNFDNKISIWKDDHLLKEFFYEVVLDKCFFNIGLNNYELSMNSFEKVLISNMLIYKNTLNK
ncbi:MAG: hypothetical protein TYPL_2610 [Candidatus Tyloplasma litorale]|nr:MAG: hypothetical protein TYPL_2610 [Mycoplasmatales bacterium]